MLLERCAYCIYEAANIDAEIKPIIEILNKKGYKQSILLLDIQDFGKKKIDIGMVFIKVNYILTQESCLMMTIISRKHQSIGSGEMSKGKTIWTLIQKDIISQKGYPR